MLSRLVAGDSGPYHLGLCTGTLSVMFTQRQNCITMHFSKCIPVIKQLMTVYELPGSTRSTNVC